MDKYFDNGVFLKKEILVIDDEEPVIRSLERILRRQGYNIYSALNSDDAFEILKNKSIDMVISDICMPGMDGYELLRKIKAQYPGIIRIILSTFIDSPTIVKYVADGTARAHIAKPFSYEAFKEILERLFSLHDSLRTEDLLEKISHLQTLPAIPAMYTQLIELIHRQAPIDEICRFISGDPNYVAQILRITNSAFIGTRIGSVKQAIIYLGLNTLSNLVLSFELFRDFLVIPEHQKLVEMIWLHANATNKLFQNLYQATHAEKVPDEISCIGLMIDIGILLMIRDSVIYCEKTKNILESNFSIHTDLDNFEHIVFGTSHSILGAYLLNMWNLPYSLVEICMYHHNPNGVKSGNGEICALVHIAECFAWKYITNATIVPGFDEMVYTMVPVERALIDSSIVRTINEMNLQSTKTLV